MTIYIARLDPLFLRPPTYLWAFKWNVGPDAWGIRARALIV